MKKIKRELNMNKPPKLHRTLQTILMTGIFVLTVITTHAEESESSSKQKVLDRFIGDWKTEYKMPIGDWNTIETKGSAELTYTKILGGKFVQETSKHGNKKTAMSIYGYDENLKQYRLWWFNSQGLTSESKGTWDPDTKTLNWINKTKSITTKTKHHFIDDNTFEWEVVAMDNSNNILFKMEGKATRTKTSKK